MRWLVAIITGCPILAGPTVMLLEPCLWLETGIWAPLRFGSLLDHWAVMRPFTPFGRVNWFIDWSPLSMAVFIVSIPFAYAGYGLLRLYDHLTLRA